MSTGTGRRNAEQHAVGSHYAADDFEQPLRRVGKYRILSELGRGGMANVFLAVAFGMGGVNKLVVLKALLPELSPQPEALSMFLDEARLAARLNHPNVVQTYEVGTEGDRQVIVMEYLEGQSLAAILKRLELLGQPISLATHLRIISNALEGLHYAHELTDYDGSALMLVHRDVSPHNLFVTYEGQVKVLDFGIAKAATTSTNTVTGVIKGKIAYMAPEQMVGEALDRRADLYSVGCMLWAATTGQNLWKDTPDVQIMRRVINADIPLPESVNPACDAELSRIVQKAMHTSVDQRYATALELQADLDEYLESLSGSIKPKQIGSFVSSLFADTRAELKSVVERQLALASELQNPEDLSEVRGALGPVARNHGSSSGQRASVDRGPARPAWPVWAGLAALLLMGGGGLYAALRPTTPPPSMPSAASAELPKAAANAPLEKASVHLRADPSTARLFLDEAPLASNPISVPLALDGSPRHLRAEAPGYVMAEATFVATRDRRVELKLQPVPAAELRPARGAAAPAAVPRAVTRAKPSPVASATGKGAGCEQPFVVTSDGIRKMRLECL